MERLRQEIGSHLETIRQQKLYRSLVEPEGIDFSSNDYLGLSKDPVLRQTILQKLQENKLNYSLFSPASRLLRGNTNLHRTIEKRLAHFKGTEDALLFPSGYQANIGLLTTLIGPQDRVLSDSQNHASIIDGLRLSRCKKIIFPHLSTNHIENTIAKPYPGGETFLVTESLFSMDGDIAPLADYAGLAKKYGAHLIVDDAHATGIFGQKRGSGLLEYFQVHKHTLAIISTFGKAFGLFGGCVAGPRWLIEYLINRCRPFIFTTAVPQVLLFGIEAVLDYTQAQPERRQRVLHLSDNLRSRLHAKHLNMGRSQGPIVPVVLGSNSRALSIAETMSEAGCDVRAIRPPTVPPGTARLRISIHANHTEKNIKKLESCLLTALKTE